MKRTFRKNTFSELFLGSDQMLPILSRDKTNIKLHYLETDQTPRLPETAHAMNNSMHASVYWDRLFVHLWQMLLFYSSMDVPNSIARYSKTGTWIDWVQARIVCVHGRRWVYGHSLAIISKFLGARWMNRLILFRHNWHIIGETKSNRNKLSIQLFHARVQL
jgi:hypothetical protein